MISILMLFLALKVTFSNTENIQIAKAEACLRDKIVTAIVEDEKDSSLAYLFSGLKLWSLDIEKGELTHVENISNVFRNVTEVIQAAGQDKFFPGHYLYGTDHEFYVNSSKTTILTRREMNGNLEKLYDSKLDTGESNIICSANYLVDPQNAVVILVFNDGHSFHCDVKKDGNKGICSKERDKLKNPAEISYSYLQQCEGLLIDEGAEGVRDDMRNDEYRLLFANKDTISYWKGKRLVYTKPLTELFGCTNEYTLVIVVLSFLALIVAFVTGGTILACVIQRRSNTQTMRLGTSSMKSPGNTFISNSPSSKT